MPVMYKLVTQQRTTHGGMKWEIGKTNKATNPGKEMCTNQVLHCYASPEQAVLFNPIHAAITNPILLEISCSEIINTDGLKHACKEQTPVKEIKLPKLTINQKVAFAIKCALLVYKAVGFVAWAAKWLSGEDRSAAAADAAYTAAARAAAGFICGAAAAAADAAYAARAAADAVLCARAAAAAAADAAYAAADAAYAARAARASHEFAAKIQETIQWVLENVS